MDILWHIYNRSGALTLSVGCMPIRLSIPSCKPIWFFDNAGSADDLRFSPNP